MCRVKTLLLAMAAVLMSSISLAGTEFEDGAAGADEAAGAPRPRFALNSTTAGSEAPLMPEVPLNTTSTTTTAPPPTTTTTTAPPPPPPTTTTTTAPPPPPPPPPPPSFVCPVQGPVSFVDSWGWPRSGGRTHEGVDMMAPTGTPTVAPVSGRVEHGESGLGGLSWYVYGDDGDVYYGTHLSGYENVGVGWVAAGTVIGYVGDSGNAAGTPHLHFEHRPGGGAPINPYPKVAEHC
jgi:murein DD-endopeptidase MepM/ murein hydrolase activator NlpD